jgi:hypothetical protein
MAVTLRVGSLESSMDFLSGGRASSNDVTFVMSRSCLTVPFRNPAIHAKSCHVGGLQNRIGSIPSIGNSHTIRDMRCTPEFQC